MRELSFLCLFALSFAVLPSCITGFTSCRQPIHGNVGQWQSRTATAHRRNQFFEWHLRFAKDNEDENKDEDSVEPTTDPKSPAPAPSSGAINFLGGISSLFGAFVIIWGTALTCGLVLNLLGYGYTFDQGGLRIDTLQELQIERYTTLQQAQVSSGSPFAGNSFQQFFLKNPFTTSLLILGVSLAYESVFKKPKK